MKKLFTLFLFPLLILSLKAVSIPKLNSFPSATATIFLDFDGHYVQSTVWNGGTSFYCAAAGMTDPQITEAFNRVAEDYRPFDINITTDSAVFLSAPLNKRIRVIITTTSAWYPGVGGVAYIGSFSWGDDTPCFVFSDRLGPYSPKMVAECCSHESGHTVGLSHQSKYGNDCNTPIEQYNSGSTTGGEIGWAPIMGNSYYRNMSNWNNGPTPYGCTAVQDNLSIIATQNGFGYRADDFAETLNSNTYTLPAAGFTVNGVISTNSDKDAFKFTLLQNSNFHLSAIPFNVGSNYIGANLDIRIELYSSPTTLIKVYDPQTTMSVTIDTVLNAGTYYFKIHGTGNTNTVAYGSLGAYTITGTAGALPIHDVTLNGTTDKNRHNLAWKIIADEAIRSVLIESSDDGIHFHSLISVLPTAGSFTYQPYKNSTVYYRLKVTSVPGQVVYSNTIALKTSGSTDRYFSISTFVQGVIRVNASEYYQYQVSDMNGRVLLTGKGPIGINSIDFSNQPPGMYIINLVSNSHSQAERFIKQ